MRRRLVLLAIASTWAAVIMGSAEPPLVLSAGFIQEACGGRNVPCPSLCQTPPVVALLRTATNWSSPLVSSGRPYESAAATRHIQVGSTFHMARWGGQRLAPHWVEVPPPPLSPPPTGSRPPPTVVVTAPPRPRYISGTVRLVHMLRAVLKSRVPVQVWACDESEVFPTSSQRQLQRSVATRAVTLERAATVPFEIIIVVCTRPRTCTPKGT